MKEKTVTYTSTWRPTTQHDCIEEIQDAMIEYGKRKWYQKKKFLLKRAVRYARKYNEIEELLKNIKPQNER